MQRSGLSRGFNTFHFSHLLSHRNHVVGFSYFFPRETSSSSSSASSSTLLLCYLVTPTSFKALLVLDPHTHPSNHPTRFLPSSAHEKFPSFFFFLLPHTTTTDLGWSEPSSKCIRLLLFSLHAERGWFPPPLLYAVTVHSASFHTAAAAAALSSHTQDQERGEDRRRRKEKR